MFLDAVALFFIQCLGRLLGMLQYCSTMVLLDADHSTLWKIADCRIYSHIACEKRKGITASDKNLSAITTSRSCQRTISEINLAVAFFCLVTSSKKRGFPCR
ncbi:uncharacterized protein [Anoplolepis gracilipes]|uniref:uncharacterized protein isoform X2 n=1 Tax=Anoplolepis gracilipes TaxID=354296 RepID=UPI003BA23AEB